MSNYILENGVPKLEPNIMKWAKWFETSDRIVEKTKIGDTIVSTIFLGIDYSWGENTPILFETMIFGGKHDEYQERYATKEQAIKGHLDACNLVKEANPERR